jgi:hypothetical protein
MRYYIWSLEHQGWWGPARRGYATDLAQAGLYTAEEAVEIMFYANRFGVWNEQAIPEADAATMVRLGWIPIKPSLF